jgi:two-component system NtrC family sensor kinase
VLAHEINNPLSGIITYAKLLRKWMDRSETDRPEMDRPKTEMDRPETDRLEKNGDKRDRAARSTRRQEVCDALDLIASESRRCGELVRNLLTFSRATPMNLQATDLNQVIDRSLRLMQHQLDLAGIHVQPQLDSSLPQCLCDAAQIEQVLLALVMNAMDAMPQGGNLWLTTSASREHGCIRIVVRDDGTGIAPEILPHLFEPFLTTKETGRGVGLGLAISHSILERHNGTIDVQSEIGRGTTFTITLPWDAEAGEAPSPAETAAARSGR